jgi:hypothetical protein
VDLVELVRSVIPRSPLRKLRLNSPHEDRPCIGALTEFDLDALRCRYDWPKRRNLKRLAKLCKEDTLGGTIFFKNDTRPPGFIDALVEPRQAIGRRDNRLARPAKRHTIAAVKRS